MSDWWIEIAELKTDKRKLEEKVSRLESELTIERCQLRNIKMVLGYFVNRWDWTMQCEQDGIDTIKLEYEANGSKDVELDTFIHCHLLDMTEQAKEKEKDNEQ